MGDTGILEIGEDFNITAETTIVAFTKIQFGNNCLLSWDVLIMDTDFHKIKNEHGAILNNPEPNIIGDKVWIGCRS